MPLHLRALLVYSVVCLGFIGAATTIACETSNCCSTATVALPGLSCAHEVLSRGGCSNTDDDTTSGQQQQGETATMMAMSESAAQSMMRCTEPTPMSAAYAPRVLLVTMAFPPPTAHNATWAASVNITSTEATNATTTTVTIGLTGHLADRLAWRQWAQRAVLGRLVNASASALRDTTRFDASILHVGLRATSSSSIGEEGRGMVASVSVLIRWWIGVSSTFCAANDDMHNCSTTNNTPRAGGASPTIPRWGTGSSLPSSGRGYGLHPLLMRRRLRRILNTFGLQWSLASPSDPTSGTSPSTLWTQTSNFSDVGTLEVVTSWLAPPYVSTTYRQQLVNGTPSNATTAVVVALRSFLHPSDGNDTAPLLFNLSNGAARGSDRRAIATTAVGVLEGSGSPNTPTARSGVFLGTTWWQPSTTNVATLPTTTATATVVLMSMHFSGMIPLLAVTGGGSTIDCRNKVNVTVVEAEGAAILSTLLTAAVRLELGGAEAAAPMHCTTSLNVSSTTNASSLPEVAGWQGTCWFDIAGWALLHVVNVSANISNSNSGVKAMFSWATALVGTSATGNASSLQILWRVESDNNTLLRVLAYDEATSSLLSPPLAPISLDNSSNANASCALQANVSAMWLSTVTVVPWIAPVDVVGRQTTATIANASVGNALTGLSASGTDAAVSTVSSSLSLALVPMVVSILGAVSMCLLLLACGCWWGKGRRVAGAVLSTAGFMMAVSCLILLGVGMDEQYKQLTHVVVLKVYGNPECQSNAWGAVPLQLLLVDASSAASISDEAVAAASAGSTSLAEAAIIRRVHPDARWSRVLSLGDPIGSPGVALRSIATCRPPVPSLGIVGKSWLVLRRTATTAASAASAEGRVHVSSDAAALSSATLDDGVCAPLATGGDDDALHVRAMCMPALEAAELARVAQRSWNIWYDLQRQDALSPLMSTAASATANSSNVSCPPIDPAVFWTTASGATEAPTTAVVFRVHGTVSGHLQSTAFNGSDISVHAGGIVLSITESSADATRIGEMSLRIGDFRAPSVGPGVAAAAVGLVPPPLQAGGTTTPYCAYNATTTYTNGGRPLNISSLGGQVFVVAPPSNANYGVGASSALHLVAPRGAMEAPTTTLCCRDVGDNRTTECDCLSTQMLRYFGAYGTQFNPNGRSADDDDGGSDDTAAKQDPTEDPITIMWRQRIQFPTPASDDDDGGDDASLGATTVIMVSDTVMSSSLDDIDDSAEQIIDPLHLVDLPTGARVIAGGSRSSPPANLLHPLAERMAYALHQGFRSDPVDDAALQDGSLLSATLGTYAPRPSSAIKQLLVGPAAQAPAEDGGGVFVSVADPVASAYLRVEITTAVRRCSLLAGDCAGATSDTARYRELTVRLMASPKAVDDGWVTASDNEATEMTWRIAELPADEDDDGGATATGTRRRVVSEKPPQGMVREISGASTIRSASGVITDGNWHLMALVCTWESGLRQCQLHIDGASSASSSGWRQCAPRGLLGMRRPATVRAQVAGNDGASGVTTFRRDTAAFTPYDTLGAHGEILLGSSVSGFDLALSGVMVVPRALRRSEMMAILGQSTLGGAERIAGYCLSSFGLFFSLVGLVKAVVDLFRSLWRDRVARLAEARRQKRRQYEGDHNVIDNDGDDPNHAQGEDGSYEDVAHANRGSRFSGHIVDVPPSSFAAGVGSGTAQQCATPRPHSRSGVESDCEPVASSATKQLRAALEADSRRRLVGAQLSTAGQSASVGLQQASKSTAATSSSTTATTASSSSSQVSTHLHYLLASALNVFQMMSVYFSSWSWPSELTDVADRVVEWLTIDWNFSLQPVHEYVVPALAVVLTAFVALMLWAVINDDEREFLAMIAALVGTTTTAANSHHQEKSPTVNGGGERVDGAHEDAEGTAQHSDADIVVVARGDNAAATGSTVRDGPTPLSSPPVAAVPHAVDKEALILQMQQVAHSQATCMAEQRALVQQGAGRPDAPTELREALEAALARQRDLIAHQDVLMNRMMVTPPAAVVVQQSPNAAQSPTSRSRTIADAKQKEGTPRSFSDPEEHHPTSQGTTVLDDGQGSHNPDADRDDLSPTDVDDPMSPSTISRSYSPSWRIDLWTTSGLLLPLDAGDAALREAVKRVIARCTHGAGGAISEMESCELQFNNMRYTLSLTANTTRGPVDTTVGPDDAAMMQTVRRAIDARRASMLLEHKKQRNALAHLRKRAQQQLRQQQQFNQNDDHGGAEVDGAHVPGAAAVPASVAAGAHDDAGGMDDAVVVEGYLTPHDTLAEVYRGFLSFRVKHNGVRCPYHGRRLGMALGIHKHDAKYRPATAGGGGTADPAASESNSGNNRLREELQQDADAAAAGVGQQHHHLCLYDTPMGRAYRKKRGLRPCPGRLRHEDGDFLFCPRSGCDFVICDACFEGNVGDLARGAWIGALDALKRMGLVQILGFLVLLLAQLLLAPVTQTCVMILFCHVKYQCQFPGCYATPSVSFLVFAILAAITMALLVVGLTVFLLRITYRRKKVIVEALLSMEYAHVNKHSQADRGGRRRRLNDVDASAGDNEMDNLQQSRRTTTTTTVAVPNAAATCTSFAQVMRFPLPGDIWRALLDRDRSMLRSLYEPYKFRFMWFHPLWITLRAFAVLPAVFADPDSLSQLGGAWGVEMLFLVLASFVPLYGDRWVTFMSRTACVHQVAQVSLNLLYQCLADADSVSVDGSTTGGGDSSSSQRHIRKVLSATMLWLFVGYLIVVAIVLVVAVLIPYCLDAWHRSRNHLTDVGANDQATRAHRYLVATGDSGHGSDTIDGPPSTPRPPSGDVRGHRNRYQ